jgi:hypothetical protein
MGFCWTKTNAPVTSQSKDWRSLGTDRTLHFEVVMTGKPTASEPAVQLLREQRQTSQALVGAV